MNSSENIAPKNPDRRNFLTAAALGTAATVAASGLTASQATATPAMIPHEKLGIATADIDIDKLPRVKQTLVAPPFFPEHDQVAKGGPKIVEVTMTVEEKQMTIDKAGTKIWAFTFNGTVPGPMIVCHQGDYIELTLINPASNMHTHNIDFHASTGALGGGALTHVKPGEKVVLRYRALEAGTFIYHCAPGGIQIPYHVVHGMNGAVTVLPRDGLKDGAGKPITYDRAYYVGEQDYYIPKDKYGKYKSYKTAKGDFADSLKVMRGLIPTHEVFNGAVGALTGDNAMKAKVGETVLIVHSQANRDTRPHLIGGHGDYVWETGSFNDAPATDLETWFIRGGSAGAAIYTFLQPGLYVYLNHNLIEAVMLGAAGHFKVTGDWNDKIMKQVLAPSKI